MENKELHPNIVIRRHIKSTAKAGKIITDLMNAQIKGELILGTITERCRQENTLPHHATRFFRKWIKKKGTNSYTQFPDELMDLSSRICRVYEEIAELDKQDQKTVFAIVTHLFYHYPLKWTQ